MRHRHNLNTVETLSSQLKHGKQIIITANLLYRFQTEYSTLNYPMISTFTPPSPPGSQLAYTNPFGGLSVLNLATRRVTELLDNSTFVSSQNIKHSPVGVKLKLNLSHCTKTMTFVGNNDQVKY